MFGKPEEGGEPQPPSRMPSTARGPTQNAVRKVERTAYSHADYIAMRKAERSGGIKPKDRAFIEGEG